MREMHKWKDKTEFSLDNRQIFFLFFGLSVIGCFVFALGIMTGRRLQWIPGQEAAALADDDSLALLDEQDEEPERFAFKAGLSASDAETIPPTRDPAIPPRDEAAIKAEAAAALAAEQVEQRVAEADAVEAVIDGGEQVVAAVAPGAAQAKPTTSAAERRFTLQMKAFSRREDADKLAAKLQHDGHDVRIESHDVRGRTWHRVRLGEFDTWDAALAAKQEFEKSEKVIAYVVSL
jgi:cell division protein FtsN